MTGEPFQGGSFVGRERELDALRGFLRKAIEGSGRFVGISGEPGVGKTSLAKAFREAAAESGATVMSGAASRDINRPFLIFSNALEGFVEGALFADEERVSFDAVFAVDSSGALLAKTVPCEGKKMDAACLAGMLATVQSFAMDSFGGAGGGLGRLEYGSMKILVEHGRGLLLAAVVSGGEHSGMREALARTLRVAEVSLVQSPDIRGGDAAGAQPLQAEMDSLASRSFVVRRSLEGVKLENERARIANNILDGLGRAAGERPLVLVLEDLQWADDASLFVLSYLARNVGHMRVVLLGTFRSGEGDVLKLALERMGAEGTASIVSLDSLRPESVGEIIDSMCKPNTFPGEFKRRLAGDCKGNPFFVTELLRQMFESGAISLADGVYALVRDDPVLPASIEEVVHRRMEALDARAMALAEYASCAGREFDAAAIYAMPSHEDARSSLGKLVESRFIVMGNGRAGFSHAFFQEAIYRGLSERWRSAHHRSLGEYYEREYAQDRGAVVYELARHFYRSSEHGKAVRYCFAAGEKAEGAYAPEQAIRYYQEALHALEKAREAEGDSPTRVDGHERIGTLRAVLGDYEAAMAEFRKALALAIDGRVKAELLRKTATALAETGDLEGAFRHIDDGLALVGGDCIEHWRLVIQKAKTLTVKGDFTESIALAERVVNELGRFPGHANTLFSAFNTLGGVHWHTGDYEKARECYMKATEAAEAGGDLQALAQVFNNVGATYHSTGDLDHALEYYRKALAMHEKVGNQSGMGSVLSNIGLIHFDKGNMDEALVHHERSLAVRQRIGDQEGIAISFNNVGSIYYGRGEFALALECFERSLGIRTKMGNQYGIAISYDNIGEILYWLGDLGRALDYTVRGLAIQREIGDQEGVAFTHNNMGTILLAMGRRTEAADSFSKGLALSRELGAKEYVSAALRGIASVRISEGNPGEGLQPCEEALSMALDMGMALEVAKCELVAGTVNTSMKNWVGASGHFVKAMDGFSALRADGWLSVASLEKARMLAAKSEKDEAGAEAKKALQAMEARGMRHFAAECAKLIESLDA